MQFRHPHGFRPAVHAVLTELAPDVWDALIAAGAEPAVPAGTASGSLSGAVGPVGLRARRSTFERGLRRALAAEPGLSLVVGTVDEIVVEGNRLVGVRAEGGVAAADCVVVATGRAGRLGEEFRAPAEGGPCGFAYISRTYRARPGAGQVGPFPQGAVADGYLSIVFPQDAGTLSTLVVRSSTDAALARLRHIDVFDRVAARIPNLASWVDPDGFEPITDPLPGGGLVNRYQSALDGDGRCAVPGLLFVGDTVLTTNPQAGRGVSTGLMQVRALLALLAETADLAEVAVAFDAWCESHLRPWFADHVHWDDTLLRRWAGKDLDLRARIPSDVICAAAQVDRRIAPAATAYGTMATASQVLDPFQDIVRALLRSGWRPPIADGPSRAELAELAEFALPAPTA
jgi:2-polyprenyl-6-methoxyphenol hydroxylase-like FAD-dependent oxidoreductase